MAHNYTARRPALPGAFQLAYPLLQFDDHARKHLVIAVDLVPQLDHLRIGICQPVIMRESRNQGSKGSCPYLDAISQSDKRVNHELGRVLTVNCFYTTRPSLSDALCPGSRTPRDPGHPAM